MYAFKNDGLCAPTPYQLASDITWYYDQLNSNLETPMDIKPQDIVLFKSYSAQSQIVIKLLYLYGLRISEILDIKFSDTIGKCLYLIKTKKNGIPCHLYLPGFDVSQKIMAADLNKKIFFGTNYKQIYAILLALNLQISHKKLKTRKVCHAARVKFAQKIQYVCSPEEQSALLHHKRLETKKYYV